MNCCGNNWRCLDLLNWRLCDYKCVSNTIWLKMYLIWPFGFGVKSNASQKDIKLPVPTSPIRSDLPLEDKTRSRYRQFYIFLIRGRLYILKPVEVVGHCKSFQLLELAA